MFHFLSIFSHEPQMNDFSDKDLDAKTTWGKTPEFEDIRALRRLNNLYIFLDKAGTISAICMTVLATSLILYTLYTANFENLTVYDGSQFMCFIDDGEIKHD